jgi:hypothetical protein
MTCKVRHRVLNNQKVYAALTGHPLQLRLIRQLADAMKPNTNAISNDAPYRSAPDYNAQCLSNDFYFII